MTSTLALAARLRAMDDETLVATLDRRGIATTGIRDFFDLADALLDADAIQSCLSRLDRRTLGLLWSLSAHRMTAQELEERATPAGAPVGRLLELLFVADDADGLTCYPEVSDQLRRWPGLGLPDPAALASAVPETEYPRLSDSGRERIDHLAAERAFSATTAVAELLFELEREPARLLARGAVGLPETRRLALAIAIEEHAVPLLIGTAERAGLVARDRLQLLPADGRGDWLERTAGERWIALAGAWASELPDDIRTHLARRPDALWGPALRDWLVWLYPAGGDWLRGRVDTRLREAEHLGITAEETLSTAGVALLAGDAAAASSLLSAQLPAPVERLYLQHDLSAVAPGPLAPGIDARLRTMADVEGRAIASSYRISAGSISRAVAGGETAESILDFLDGISLSGIPQPLRYLVDETVARHGLLRVGELPRSTAGDLDAMTYVRSEDSVLLGTVLVDRSLAALGLSASGMNQIVSRRDLSQLFWALAEARYPVAAEDSSGRVISLQRHERRREPSAEPASPLVGLVERLRLLDADAPDDTGQAWLSRQLEAAIRSKSTLTVSVRMPSGVVIDYRLEPTSIAGGRLRARDQVSEIERTLPLSSIAAVSAD